MKSTRSCSLLLAVTAARAPLYIGDYKADIVDFIRRQQLDSGAFPGRSGQPDIYYSQFALQTFAALDEPIPSMGEFIHETFAQLSSLDLVHTVSLGICAALTHELPAQWQNDLLDQIQKYRAEDGAFSTLPNQKYGSPYGTFLAIQAMEVLEQPIPEYSDFSAFLTPHGSFVNQDGSPHNSATATSTAAAVACLWTSHQSLPPKTTQWLRSLYSSDFGGFRVAQNIPIPDLLSTAVALFALDLQQCDLTPFREQTTQFVEALWDDSGGFSGHPADDQPDIEYTWYAILTLGCLA